MLKVHTTFIPDNTKPETTLAPDVQHKLVNAIIQYISCAFPVDFSFHASATELASLPRLPAMVESRPSVSDPRFANIQFGAFTPEVSESLDSELILSSILLSIPLRMLELIINNQLLGEKLGWPRVVSITNEVLEEREKRRLKVRLSKRVIPGASALQWEETKWEEKIQSSTETSSGVALFRTLVLDT